MNLSEHADHTEKVVGIRAEDIHKWIDGFFDLEGFDSFLRRGKVGGFNPYGHRQYRHCIEALDDALKEFEGKYTPEQIRLVFETHLKDDYDGYLPVQKDFEDGNFKEKYHENDDVPLADRILNKAELDEYFKGKFYTAKRKRRESSFNFKFWLGISLPTIAAVILFVSSIFVFIVPQFKENLLDQKRLMIRELTATASSAIQHYVEKAAMNEMSLAEAQSQAAFAIKALRYGEEGKDYFWITDERPRMVMHPYRSDLKGVDLTSYQDPKNGSNTNPFVESVRLVEQSNEGYLEYFWQWKDDPDRLTPKLSYVRGIPEWDWIIGTGVYIDDVDLEIENLTRKILFTFAYITLGLIALLLYILRQSLRIERNRLQAESGLIEAKERYRTLVEASSEGYVLELEGEHVYSNLAFQRLLGYSEDESLSREIWSSVIPDLAINQDARSRLKDVFLGKTVRGEFEAHARKRNGESIELLMRVSRIFFSEKNGHVISLRPITRNATAMPSMLMNNANPLSNQSAVDFLQAIRISESEGHIIRLLNALPAYVDRQIRQGDSTTRIRDMIAQAYNETVKRYIELALHESESPPVPFGFLSLGSAARREMTLFSDQDNALVFADDAAGELEQNRKYFLNLANRICSKLDQSGFPFCQGGIMAANPKWCLSLSEWKKNVSEKFENATVESLLEVNIFLDFNQIYGEQSLSESLRNYMFQQSKSLNVFLKNYALSYSRCKVPLNAFGNLKTKQKDGVEYLDLKDCITPIVVFARIYALKHQVEVPSTLDRLESLQKIGVIDRNSCQEISDIFSFFWQLRFNNQLRDHNELQRIDDTLNVKDLSDSQRRTCRKMLSSLAVYQARVSYDFLGVDPQLID